MPKQDIKQAKAGMLWQQSAHCGNDQHTVALLSAGQASTEQRPVGQLLEHFREYKRAPRKVLAHTALSDIRESIAELQYYRQAVFKPHSGKSSTQGKNR
eukprot:104362-Pelagomonas_calceolata.AAC.18